MLVSPWDEIELSKKIHYFIINKIEFKFDNSFDIKNTITHFLKNKIFHD